VIVLTSQAHITNRYKNVKKKVLNCNANVYFSKQCISRNLTPNDVNVNISNTSPAARFLKTKAQRMCVKDELKFLHIRKQKLNQKVNQMHLNLTNDWNKSWCLIEEIRNKSADNELKKKCKTIDRKLAIYHRLK
jgi:hypothetical protein